MAKKKKGEKGGIRTRTNLEKRKATSLLEQISPTHGKKKGISDHSAASRKGGREIFSA